MTLFFLRDDDANATTDVGRLERTYAPLLDAGMPVNLSVIPEVALDTLAPDGARERFIDERQPVSERVVPLDADNPLSRWVRSHQSGVEPLLHGLEHRRVRDNTEFGALTEAEAGAKIARGCDLLERAFGRRPLGFVAPWDMLSPGSMSAALDAFPLISCCFVDRKRLPLRAWPAHVAERLKRSEVLRVGRTWVLRHRGGKLDASTRASEVPALLDGLATTATVAVVVLHHWMYWSGDPAPHPAIVALAAYLRGRTVVTASQALELLR